MKRLLLVLLLVIPCCAQQWDTIAATNAACVSGACAYIDVAQKDQYAVVQITGTFTATVQFEATANGTTFVSIAGTPSGGGSAVTSATAAGAWQFNIAGYKQLRVRGSAFTSGAATVKITIGQAGSVNSASYPGVASDGASGLTVAGTLAVGATVTATKLREQPTTANALDDEFNATLNTATKWTWLNQGASTAVVNSDRLLFTAPTGAGDNIHLLVQAAPATPWTMQAKLSWTALAVNYSGAGLAAREASSGKLVVCQAAYSGAQANTYALYSNYTTYVNEKTKSAWSVMYRDAYLRLQDDGSALTCSYSPDGDSWYSLPTYSHTADGAFTSGATQVGIFANNNGTAANAYASFDYFRRVQ